MGPKKVGNIVDMRLCDPWAAASLRCSGWLGTGAETGAPEDRKVIRDSARGGSRGSGSTLSTLTEVGLPGFKPVLDARDALSADSRSEGAIVIRSNG